jgi:hypothetical protein
MDPLASIKEFREQQSAGRVVRIAPPPVLPPSSPNVDIGTLAPDVTGELDTTDLVTAGDNAAAGDPEGGHIPGTPRGRKRLMQVYLPAPARHLLDQARDAHGTLGTAVMVALRGSYDWIVDHHTPEPVEPVGPFPAPRAVRRRLVVEDARMRPIYVDPAEAAAIESLADQCEMSISELVTVALDHHYGGTDRSHR